MSPAGDNVAWSSVWALYAQQHDIFRSVFRSLARRGWRLRQDEELELVHEFLLENARPALGTFRPERGELGGWLFVVFRRFVTSTLQRRGEVRRREAATVGRLSDGSHADEREAERDLSAAKAAIAALPDAERDAMEAALLPNGSVRSVARKLAVSRWTAQRLLDSGFEKVRARLAPHLDAKAVPVIEDLQRRLVENEKEGDK